MPSRAGTAGLALSLLAALGAALQVLAAEAEQRSGEGQRPGAGTARDLLVDPDRVVPFVVPERGPRREGRDHGDGGEPDGERDTRGEPLEREGRDEQRSERREVEAVLAGEIDGQDGLLDHERAHEPGDGEEDEWNPALQRDCGRHERPEGHEGEERRGGSRSACDALKSMSTSSRDGSGHTRSEK